MTIDAFFAALADQFLATPWLEWVAVITAFSCIYLAARQHILNWPISIISVIAYAILFYEGKLYGEMALQAYFLFTALYGWHYWLKRKQENKKPIVSLGRSKMALVLIATASMAILLGTFLYHFTDTDVAYVDGALASISFMAQLLLTRKVLQNWLMWVGVDLLYVPLFLYKGFLLTAILHLILAYIAWIGYKDWRKTWLEATIS